MAEISSELIYEILKTMREEASQTRLEVRGIKGELQAMGGHLLAIRHDIANLYGAADRQDVRLGRIERRLEIAEPAH